MAQPEFLTTSELAALLRIKERKVYALAATGALPSTKAMGKLLFPRQAVDAWLQHHGSGFNLSPPRQRKQVFAGSNDPLLEWALRESRCGIASFFDGSFDGLDRFAAQDAVAAALHIHEGDAAWNVGTVGQRCAATRVVLVEFAWRERGLITAHDSDIATLGELRGRCVLPRQAEAGSQQLLLRLLQAQGIATAEMTLCAPARSETDAALGVQEGKADAAFGLCALARQHRLRFVPIIRERFDILVDSHAYFEPAMQTLWTFCRSPAFAERADALGGYDISGHGGIHFNSA